MDDQYDRAGGAVHRVQPCEEFVGLFGRGSALDKDSGVTGTVDH